MKIRKFTNEFTTEVSQTTNSESHMKLSNNASEETFEQTPCYAFTSSSEKKRVRSQKEILDTLWAVLSCGMRHRAFVWVLELCQITRGWLFVLNTRINIPRIELEDI
jgi:hypothetical protein